VEKGKSSTQLIDETCFSWQGLLSEEYEQLYQSLFRNVAFHVAVVAALAAHPQGITRGVIANYIKIGKTNLSRTLDELEECDFSSIFYPLINKKKEAVYKLTDLYSLFYLKFMQANKGADSQIWE
jgi:hypothetical protein